MDPIANLLVSIKNAGERRYESVRVPFSKINFNIAKILEREGYVKRALEVQEKARKFLLIELKYIDKTFIIKGLKRISKPGRRVYRKSHALPYIKGNMGVALISTPSGLMTNLEARKKGLGGEVLLEVW